MKILIINDGRPVFFTSDTHFLHGRILTLCERTRRGENAEEMTLLLAEAWRKTVPENGVVFHLGDFAFGSKAKHKDILESLTGEVHLVMGNHDDEDHVRSLGFASVQDMLLVKTPLGSFHLTHYPMADWYANTRHLHGHTHGSIPTSAYRMDVGIDGRGDDLMRPWRVEEVVSLMDRQRQAREAIARIRGKGGI